MIVMARDRSYEDLLKAVSSHRVLVWTCNTCVRFCDGLGGRDAAESLARRLSEDGVDVVGVESSATCCFMRNAVKMAGSAEGCDLVLAVCCDIGARNASEATGVPVLNPVITFGPGYLDADGRPRVASVLCGSTVIDEPLSEAAARSGCLEGPF